MKQIALKHFTDIDWSLLALILFFISFLFLIYKVYFYESQEHIRLLSELPFESEEI